MHGKSLTGRFVYPIFCLVFLTFGAMTVARAATVIVAFGASNTVGKNGASYPAELEVLLNNKGYNVRVINAGANGDTTADMLARVDSVVPSDARLVLVSAATPNDRKAGILSKQKQYLAQILGKLKARGIRVLVLPPLSSLARRSTADPAHYDPVGYRAIASALMPRVAAALGPPTR
jgi:acyl-CoA thioesterase I